MRKISSVIFRKHPGGLQARIKWVRWILGYGLLTSALLFIFSIGLMFTQEPLAVPVKLSLTATDNLNIEEQFGLMQGLKGDLLIKNPTVLDRVVLDHPANRTGWAGALFWALICWFLIRILNDLDLKNPFRMSISRHINAIAIVLFMFPLFQLIRMGYSYVVVRRVGAASMPDTDLILTGFTGYLLLALMLTVIAYVYRVGCRMQEDQELTV